MNEKREAFHSSDPALLAPLVGSSSRGGPSAGALAAAGAPEPGAETHPEGDARVRERLRYLLWARGLRTHDRQVAAPHAS